MSDERPFDEIAAEHFFAVRLCATCLCGWTGEPVSTPLEAQADHAAHVHVVAGLATEDET